MSGVRTPVLVADDSQTMRTMLQHRLTSAGFDVVLAGDGLEAASILMSDAPPRLAVLDWTMPGLDGVEVCRRLRRERHTPYVYVVLLTARGSSADTVEALDAGADDYLRKPFDAPELEARLRAGRRIVALQEELVTAYEALRSESQRDALTSCLNRGSTDDLLQLGLLRSAREGRPFAVAMFDLDFFKQVNDRYGHAGGDAVLRAASLRAHSCIRPTDALGRYGGEEFVVVLPGCTADVAARIAERIRVELSSQPVVYDGMTIPVSASFGVAATNGQEAMSPTQLIKAADGALYASKRAGRNRVTVADPPTTS